MESSINFFDKVIKGGRKCGVFEIFKFEKDCEATFWTKS